MSGSKLDQIVKGAPLPGTSIPSVAPRSNSPSPPAQKIQSPDSTSSAPVSTPDHLHSSPPQIYLNLLILEASLRSQYLTLRARRRQNTFFLLLLAIWIAWFAYLLFLRPREDGSGVGGSVYWVVEMGEKVALMGGIVTGMLIWGTGQWERGVRWPRRWLGIANRGLRNINAKIVLIKGPWWKETFGYFAFLFPYSTFFPAQSSSSQYIQLASVTSKEKETRSQLSAVEDDDNDLFREEDISPGGDYIKLLLLPKPFSPEFRENWELYRLEYWEKENERRAKLREFVRKQQIQLARQRGCWFWWTGWRGRKQHVEAAGRIDVDKSHQRHQLGKTRRRQSYVRTESDSRNASRSSTLSNAEGEQRPDTTRMRRGSTTTSGSERRRKVKSAAFTDTASMPKLTSINRPA